MTKTEIEEQIQENANRISDNVNKIIEIFTAVFGVNGNNGINGRVKEMETSISDLQQAVNTISTNLANMSTKIDNIEKTAKFWTRAVGIAVITQILALGFSLLQNHPIIFK